MTIPTDPTQLPEQVATETATGELLEVTPLPEKFDPTNGGIFIYVANDATSDIGGEIFQLLDGRNQEKLGGRAVDVGGRIRFGPKPEKEFGPFVMASTRMKDELRFLLFYRTLGLGRPYIISGLIRSNFQQLPDGLYIDIPLSNYSNALCLIQSASDRTDTMTVENFASRDAQRVRKALEIFESWVIQGFSFGPSSNSQRTTCFSMAYALAGREMGINEIGESIVRVGVLAQAPDGSNVIRWLSNPNSTEEVVETS